MYFNGANPKSLKFGMHDLFIAVLGFYNGGTSNTVVVSESIFLAWNF